MARRRQGRRTATARGACNTHGYCAVGGGVGGRGRWRRWMWAHGCSSCLRAQSVAQWCIAMGISSQDASTWVADLCSCWWTRASLFGRIKRRDDRKPGRESKLPACKASTAEFGLLCEVSRGGTRGRAPGATPVQELVETAVTGHEGGRPRPSFFYGCLQEIQSVFLECKSTCCLGRIGTSRDLSRDFSTGLFGLLRHTSRVTKLSHALVKTYDSFALDFAADHPSSLHLSTSLPLTLRPNAPDNTDDTTLAHPPRPACRSDDVQRLYVYGTSGYSSS